MSVTNNAVVSAALGYVEANPAELEAVRDLVVLSLLGPHVTLPDTLPAHLACRAVVVTPDWHLLQVAEPVRSGWQLPGGHVGEEDSSLLGSTLRQLRRRTGIDPDTLRPESTLPLDVDAVPIAPAPSLAEPEHVHYEFRYLLHLPSRELTRADAGLRWVPADDVPGRLGTKLRRSSRMAPALR
ncbi:NUDIX domain-containing protein [Pseudofrankia sp. DC12]|uniref:NUDIX domain-containing protein n=1 Tax=Pseudofrankia sp. DC12 TaxID=683315 RepID=UPI000A7F2FF2|nr:NUDIX domain-containing protein [Pseudofrankia sp. DC12]